MREGLSASAHALVIDSICLSEYLASLGLALLPQADVRSINKKTGNSRVMAVPHCGVAVSR